MRRIPFFVLNAFTETLFSGNPAGVFLNAEQLTADEMRQLADEISLESAFVLPGQGGANLSLRYFTGTREIPLCGHATVSAMTALARAGRILREGTVRVDTPVGVLRMTLQSRPDGESDVTLFQNLPEFGPPLNPGAVAEVAQALGSTPEAVTATGLPVQSVSTGSPFLFVPVLSRDRVDAAPKSLEAIARISEEQGTLGVYVFTVERADSGQTSTWGRCFAPAAGLNEDPVTGSASGALGCLLARQGTISVDADGVIRFVAWQGYAGGRGGNVRIAVTVRDGDVSSVAITGSAVSVAEGTFTLP